MTNNAGRIPNVHTQKPDRPFHGGSSPLGSNPTAQSGETPKLPRRQLKISDINVVNKHWVLHITGVVHIYPMQSNRNCALVWRLMADKHSRQLRRLRHSVTVSSTCL